MMLQIIKYLSNFDTIDVLLELCLTLKGGFVLKICSFIKDFPLFKSNYQLRLSFVIWRFARQNDAIITRLSSFSHALLMKPVRKVLGDRT